MRYQEILAENNFNLENLTPLEKEAYFHMLRIVDDKATLQKVFSDNDPKYVDTKNHWIKLYQVEKAKQAKFIHDLQKAQEEYQRKGPLSKYRCWNCGTKFEAHENDPHICPQCNTKLDEAVGCIIPGSNTTADVQPGTLTKMLKSYFGQAGVDSSGHPIKGRKRSKMAK